MHEVLKLFVKFRIKNNTQVGLLADIFCKVLLPFYFYKALEPLKGLGYPLMRDSLIEFIQFISTRGGLVGYDCICSGVT